MYFTSGCIVQYVCGMLSVDLCVCIVDPPPEHMIVQTRDRAETNCMVNNALHKWQLNDQHPQPEYYPILSNSGQNYTLSLFFPRNGKVVVKCVCKPNDPDLEECSATTTVIILGIHLQNIRVCTIMFISESEWST